MKALGYHGLAARQHRSVSSCLGGGTRRSMVRPCGHPGCGVLTLGSRCLVHDSPVTRIFMRGRPVARSCVAIRDTPTTMAGSASR